MTYIDELAKELVALYHAGYSPQEASSMIFIESERLKADIFARALVYLDTEQPRMENANVN